MSTPYGAARATPQELVERAVAASRATDVVVLVHSSTSANLRWATNTLTTNGAMHTLEATVISVVSFRVASPLIVSSAT